MAVAKALEQLHRAQLFEVLGDARLAQPENLRELGDAALALGAEHDDAQPGRVGQGFQLHHKLLYAIFHKKINISLYFTGPQSTSLFGPVTGNGASCPRMVLVDWPIGYAPHWH
jgi:hypothetical protein